MHNDRDSNKDLDPENSGDHDPDDLPFEAGDEEHSPRRRRKRIKIRKRVRLKRNSSPKKKIRKILEMIAWAVIIIVFIVTLVVLITELDLNEKNRKKRTQLGQSQPAVVIAQINHPILTNTVSGCY